MNGAAIDKAMAEYLATKCKHTDATELTKADLASVRSINITNQGVESFAGLTSTYFPNLTSISLTKEAGIVVDSTTDELNAMDDSIKQQLKDLALENCTNLKGGVEVSGFDKLENLSFANCSNINSATGFASTLKTLNIQNSKITSIDVSQCIELEALNLWNCISLGSDGGEIIGLDSLTNLKFLNVAQSQLTELALTNTDHLINLCASNCKQLTSLTFAEKAFTSADPNYQTRLEIIGDSALQAINISKMTMITQLNVTGCDALTKETLIKRDDQTLTGTIPDTLK